MNEYFMERISQDIRDINENMKEMNVTIQDLQKFKFKMLGAAIMASALWTVLINLIFIYIEGKK